MVLSFNLPIHSAWFELRLGSQHIRQSVVVPTFILEEPHMSKIDDTYEMLDELLPATSKRS